MKRLSEANPVRVAIVGLVVVALLVSVAVNVGAIRALVVGRSYTAVFSEAGGLKPGDQVRISGLPVGTVDSVELDGPAVRVDFSLIDAPNPLQAQTRAGIKTENPLGKKFLELDSRGGGELADGATIPLERTEAPYSVSQALSDLTSTTAEIDTESLARSFDTLSTTFADTAPDLAATLDGVRRLSQTIASRDDALREVLQHSSSVTGVLNERSIQITELLGDGSALFAELEQRRRTIHELFVNTQRVADQISGLVSDNEQSLKPALQEVQRAIAVFNKNEDNLRQGLQLLAQFGRALGEAVGGGPFFYAFLGNLAGAGSSLAPCAPSLVGVGQAPGYSQAAPLDSPPPGVAERSEHQPYYPPRDGPQPKPPCQAVNEQLTGGGGQLVPDLLPVPASVPPSTVPPAPTSTEPGASSPSPAPSQAGVLPPLPGLGQDGSR